MFSLLFQPPVPATLPASTARSQSEEIGRSSGDLGDAGTEPQEARREKLIQCAGAVASTKTWNGHGPSEVSSRRFDQGKGVAAPKVNFSARRFEDQKAPERRRDASGTTKSIPAAKSWRSLPGQTTGLPSTPLAFFATSGSHVFVRAFVHSVQRFGQSDVDSLSSGAWKVTAKKP